MDYLFTQALDELLRDQCTPTEVRRVESRPEERRLWSHLTETGLTDVLLPEHAAGAALPLEQAFELWALCGRYALPFPLPETQWARALLQAAGSLGQSDGPIGLGLGALPDEPGQALTVDVSAGRCCDHVLACTPGGLRLLPVRTAQVQPHGLALDARLQWASADWTACPVLAPQADLSQVQALLAAAQMSGAMLAVLEQTLDYANQRQQFGKPIGKFQAIQHNLSVLAEQVYAARMAVRLACQGAWTELVPLRVALAKARASQAAQQVAALAHGLHGAIGFTHEFDLPLRTRRLYAWRLCAGAESHWQKCLGQALLAQDRPSLDLLRELTDL